MVSNVAISIQSTNSTITIPYQSVIKNGDENHYVYKVDTETNTVKKQIVKVGVLTDNMIQIISGVSIGDVLVVEGQHKLSDNDHVVI
jgi:multidrug efflux pump subunit AcrA (membrane-fusion protein)